MEAPLNWWDGNCRGRWSGLSLEVPPLNWWGGSWGGLLRGGVGGRGGGGGGGSWEGSCGGRWSGPTRRVRGAILVGSLSWGPSNSS